MGLRRLLFVCVLFWVFVSSGIADESIRLRFQIIKNGAVVANPEMSINEGSVGRIEIRDSLSLAFAPRVYDSHLTLTFDIEAGDKHLQPQLAVDTTGPATISWTTAHGESMRVTVAVVR